MKKLVLGLVAVAALVALGPVVKRRARKMHEHCMQMMEQCAGGGEAPGHEAMGRAKREHCAQMAVQREEQRELVATA